MIKAPLTPEQFDAIDQLITFRLEQHRKFRAWSAESLVGARLRDAYPQKLMDLKIELTMDRFE
jgi:hypothetical protein